LRRHLNLHRHSSAIARKIWMAPNLCKQHLRWLATDKDSAK